MFSKKSFLSSSLQSRSELFTPKKISKKSESSVISPQKYKNSKTESSIISPPKRNVRKNKFLSDIDEDESSSVSNKNVNKNTNKNVNKNKPSTALKDPKKMEFYKMLQKISSSVRTHSVSSESEDSDSDSETSDSSVVKGNSRSEFSSDDSDEYPVPKKNVAKKR